MSDTKFTAQDLESTDPLDSAWVQERLRQFPFVQIDGITNIRTLGGYEVKKGAAKDTLLQRLTTRRRALYRSAEISGITDTGRVQMLELGIKKVFDLRSDVEMRKYDTPIPDIEGVEVLHVPVFKTEDYSPEVMARRFQLYASGQVKAFMELYSQILDNGGHAFGAILRHVRDRPEEGCLFHCTAGKDRTAVIAAILLLLAGVDDDTIADDYELTRVGREPIRQKILDRLSKEPIFAQNKDAALNMLTSRHETMIAFLKMLRERYGGAEMYAQNMCNLSGCEVEKIKRNLVEVGNDNASQLEGSVRQSASSLL